MNRNPVRRTIAAATLAVLVAAGALASSSAPASAWAYNPVSGTRGNVDAPQVYVGDLSLPSGGTQFTLYSGIGPNVGRSSAASGAQTVYGRYRVQTWNGSAWVTTAASPLLSRTIAAGSPRVRFPALYMQPLQARGYFRLTWAFDWYSSSGRLVGSTHVISNRTSDHVCVTPIRWCASYSGFFRTGGYLTGAW